MRHVVITTAIAAALLVPTEASADMADCPRQVERTYTKKYNKVANMHGNRAPGRNIRKYGVRFKKVTFNAVCSELRRSTRQLDKLLKSPPYPTLQRTAVPPRQPPAGVKSAGIGAGGILAAIRACESGGVYTTNTGNGFYGAYQFTLSTWAANAPAGWGHVRPDLAPPWVQDMAAATLFAKVGTHTSASWPNCP